MVGSEQVSHSSVSQYDGSKSEVVNKNSEKLERMVYLLFYTSYRNEILTAIPECSKLRVSKRKSEIQDGGFENSVAQISAFTQDSNIDINIRSIELK